MYYGYYGYNPYFYAYAYPRWAAYNPYGFNPYAVYPYAPAPIVYFP